MSIPKFQKLSWKLNKLANKLLEADSFDVYRPASYTNPIQPSYKIDSQPVSFALDKGFSSAPGIGVQVYETVVDGQLQAFDTLQQGDIFYNDVTGDTYYVASVEVHLPIKSIKCPNRITIQRAGYADSGNGYAPLTPTTIATNVPAYIQVNGGAIGPLGYFDQSNTFSDTLISGDVYLWMTNGSIQTRDIITDENGNELQVQAAYFTELGYKLSVSEMSP